MAKQPAKKPASQQGQPGTPPPKRTPGIPKTDPTEKIPPRIEPDMKAESISVDEAKKIVRMVCDDAVLGQNVQQNWQAKKVKDIQHYLCERPSIIEALSKKQWQSDRNLGLAPATADSFQATLLATCYNPDSINFVATEVSDINNKVNQETFVKWGLGKQEANFGPEADDFIHNRITLGTSYFEIYWKVWFEWVDKRMPKYDKDHKLTGYDIETKKMRFEKGIIENISDIDDILIPEYGKSLQELPFVIRVMHLQGNDIITAGKEGIFKNVTEGYLNKLRGAYYEWLKSEIGEERLRQQGITTQTTFSNDDIRTMTIDLYKWFGDYTLEGRTEKYRFIVDPINMVLLSAKPLRKITRSGKIPIVGGGLIRIPGQIRGRSLMTLIAPVVNAFNNVFNQKSDFQYVTNCPFGFHNPEEGYTQEKYELEPGVSYPVGGKPSDSVYFPNMQRSMAWAESDIRILLEVLERLTGAASYFASHSRGSKGTATRDMLVDKNSETRFGLWVFRIMQDICEAISLWFQMYQDWAPPNLGERVLGPDGKQLFKNISIDTLRGGADVQMTPDLTAGSKAYNRQMQLWIFENLSQTFWLNPQVNPSGNYNLCLDTLQEVKGLSENAAKRYLGPAPKSDMEDQASLEEEWSRFMKGDDFAPPEGETQLAALHLQGHYKQRAERSDELDEEYRGNLDRHIFKTLINYMKFVQQVQAQRAAEAIAAARVMSGEGQPGQPGQPGPQGAPGSAPGGAPMGGPPAGPGAAPGAGTIVPGGGGG